MVSEFSRTCVASRSLSGLTNVLTKGGWKAFPSPAESRVANEIVAVTPMLEAQGLSSDYTIYWRKVGDRYLELAVSETKKPINGDRKLVGCSMYDFDANSPLDETTISTLAGTAVGQKSAVGDVQVEKWDRVFGEGSGMRAVFVPAGSPMGAQLGFTGMMLGTHFLDGAK